MSGEARAVVRDHAGELHVVAIDVVAADAVVADAIVAIARTDEVRPSAVRCLGHVVVVAAEGARVERAHGAELDVRGAVGARRLVADQGGWIVRRNAVCSRGRPAVAAQQDVDGSARQPVREIQH